MTREWRDDLDKPRPVTEAPNFYEPVLGTPDQFAQYVRAEATKWGKVVQDAKLTLN
jgi:tripartite-type tricarboxylate transporter receptor subunit TctC